MVTDLKPTDVCRECYHPREEHGQIEGRADAVLCPIPARSAIVADVAADFDPAEPEPAEAARHWSEDSGRWYYVGTVGQQWDHIRHDIEAEDLTAEMTGMFLLWKDSRSDPAPVTRVGWEMLARMEEPFATDPEPVCVGRIVDGMCVPIGTDEDGDPEPEETDPDQKMPTD